MKINISRIDNCLANVILTKVILSNFNNHKCHSNFIKFTIISNMNLELIIEFGKFIIQC